MESCLSGALPAARLSASHRLLEHAGLTVLASRPPARWLRWLAAVLAGLERLLVRLLDVLDEPREAQPELLDPALRLEELSESLLTAVRRRRVHLQRRGEDAQVDSSAEGRSGRWLERAGDGSRCSDDRDASGSPDEEEGEARSELNSTPDDSAPPSARWSVRTALESRLRLVELGQLQLPPPPPSPPPPPPGSDWAHRLGDNWPAVYQLSLQWALASLEEDTTRGGGPRAERCGKLGPGRAAEGQGREGWE